MNSNIKSEETESTDLSISKVAGEMTYPQFRRFCLVVEYAYQTYGLFFKTRKHTWFTFAFSDIVDYYKELNDAAHTEVDFAELQSIIADKLDLYSSKEDHWLLANLVNQVTEGASMSEMMKYCEEVACTF